MKSSLTEYFKAFLDRRIHQVDLSLDDNDTFQKALNTLDKTQNNLVDVALAAINIAEITAYKQGFIDGLSIMAGPND